MCARACVGYSNESLFCLIGEAGRDADIRRVGEVFNCRGGVTLTHLQYFSARECQSSAKT